MWIVFKLGKSKIDRRNFGDGFSVKTESDEQFPKNDLYFFVNADTLKHGILIIKNKIIRYSNPSAARMFGCNINELVETNISTARFDNEIYRIKEFYKTKSLTNKVSFNYETMLSHKRCPIHVQILSKPIEYEGNQSDLLIIRDITSKNGRQWITQADKAMHDEKRNAINCYGRHVSHVKNRQKSDYSTQNVI